MGCGVGWYSRIVLGGKYMHLVPNFPYQKHASCSRCWVLQDGMCSNGCRKTNLLDERGDDTVLITIGLLVRVNSLLYMTQQYYQKQVVTSYLYIPRRNYIYNSTVIVYTPDSPRPSSALIVWYFLDLLQPPVRPEHS